MSQRNSRRNKKLRKLRDAMRDTPDASIDLVQWLKDRRHAQTAGEAVALLKAGSVTVNDKVIGRFRTNAETDKDGNEIDGRYEAVRLVPASFRKHIEVV